MRLVLKKRRHIGFLAIPALVVAGLFGVFTFIQTPSTTSALSGSEFDPGNIIDDGVFYNPNAINAQTIQAFLQSKVPGCDTQGSRPASEFGRSDLTRAQYAATQGWHGPPYTCMRDYRQNTPQMEAASGLCEAMSANSNRMASEIIYDIAQACHINPQVLIVLLQKEQSLVTDTWPLNSQYTKATGFACPDTNPPSCDPAYGGFFYQVYYAARQFQVYKKYPNSYNYVAGRNNTIYFHPGPYVNGAHQSITYCGSTQVYIQNQATAALYIYTPYQPNAAALNNLYGYGDGCSSYGNRNFWRLFSEWFGSTRLSYERLNSPAPRWMVVNTNVRKMVPGTNANSIDPADGTITAGTQLYFIDKISIDGRVYLRTAHDYDRGLNKGIPLSSVSEVPYEPMAVPGWRQISANSARVHPASGQVISQLPVGTQLNFSQKIRVADVWYYRTATDASQGLSIAVRASDVIDIPYVSFDTPRYMRTNKTTTKINAVTGQTSSSVGANTDIFFTSKIYVNGTWYFRTQTDTNASSSYALSENDVNEIPYQGFTPRWERLNTQSTKVNPLTGASTTQTFSSNTDLFVAEEITVNSVRYYRTAYDKNSDNDYVIPASRFTSIAFEPVAENRTLRVGVRVSKLNPITGVSANDWQPVGRDIVFSSKIYINGIWYFRSQNDTNSNTALAIPYSSLRELP